jgi:hypothetical protein
MVTFERPFGAAFTAHNTVGVRWRHGAASHIEIALYQLDSVGTPELVRRTTRRLTAMEAALLRIQPTFRSLFGNGASPAQGERYRIVVTLRVSPGSNPAGVVATAVTEVRFKR